MKISLVVPTYEERANVRPLVERSSRALAAYDYEIIVVDDDSPDNTAAEAAMLSSSYPVKVIKREGVRGLGSAILEGFRNAQGDVLGVIDADLQHPPEVLPELAAAMENGADIAIASRYIPGGTIEDWTRFRRLVSRMAIVFARLLTKVKDPTSGCFMVDRTVIEPARLSPKGYKILMEILVKGRHRCVKEIPYTFSNRQMGRSKLGVTEYLRYVELLILLYCHKLRSLCIWRREYR